MESEYIKINWKKEAKADYFYKLNTGKTRIKYWIWPIKKNYKEDILTNGN